MRKGQFQEKDRTGETKMMKCGLLATIVKYDGSQSVVVRFENGTEKHTCYYNFAHGIVEANPKKKVERLGETKMMKCGLKCTIIEYTNHSHIRVRFENGFEKNAKYERFLTGSIIPKTTESDSTNESRLGQVKTMKCGEKAQIIKSVNSSNIIVRFLKSGVEKHATYKGFREGLISPKEKVDWNKIIKESFVSNQCGLKYNVIGRSKNPRKCIIRFEDGTMHETCYRDAYRGSVVHPGFNKAGKMINFLGYSGEKIKIKDKIWYKIKDIGLMTTKQIIKETLL